jgi:hypothetical protein
MLEEAGEAGAGPLRSIEEENAEGNKGSGRKLAVSWCVG